MKTLKILALLCLCIPILFTCKHASEPQSGLSSDHLAAWVSHMTWIKLFDQEVTINLTNFQIRSIGDPNRCLVPGKSQFVTCDGIAHWQVEDACTTGEGALRYKIRFQPANSNACLAFVNQKPTLSDCGSDDPKKRMPSAFGEALSCSSDALVGPYLRLSAGAGDGRYVIEPSSGGGQIDAAFFKPAQAIADVGIRESIGWRERPLADLGQAFVTFAADLLSGKSQNSLKVAYSELAPAARVSDNSIKEASAYAHEPEKSLRHWGWDNNVLCDNYCSSYNRVCADYSREIVTEGFTKRVHAVCTAGNNYFSNNIHVDRPDLPVAMTFTYKKTGEGDSEQLRSIRTIYVTTEGIKVAVVGKKGADSCDSDSVSSTLVFTDTYDANLPKNILEGATEVQYLTKVFVEPTSNNRVGALILEAKDGKAYRVDSSGIKSTSVPNSWRPPSTTRADVACTKPSAGASQEADTFLLDSQAFLTPDQEALICKIGEDDFIAQKNNPEVVNIGSDGGLPAWLQDIYDFLQGDEPMERASLKWGFEPVVSGFYGFARGDGIQSLGSISLDMTYAKQFGSRGSFDFTLRQSELAGKSEVSCSDREIRNFDTLVEVGIENRGLISDIEIKVGKDKLKIGQSGGVVTHNILELNVGYDLAAKFEQDINIGISANHRFNVFTPRSTGESRLFSRAIPDDFYLCRIDYREWPKNIWYTTSVRPIRSRMPIETNANTGGIHNLKFYFAKKNGSGGFDEDVHVLVASESDFRLEQELYQDDPERLNWKVMFPKNLPDDEKNRNRCSKSSPNHVVGFFGQVAEKSDSKKEEPAAIMNMGVYYTNQLREDSGVAETETSAVTAPGGICVYPGRDYEGFHKCSDESVPNFPEGLHRDISSITVDTGFCGEAYFGPNYTGNLALELWATNYRDLKMRRNHINDRIESIKIGRIKDGKCELNGKEQPYACLYKDSGYRGNETCIYGNNKFIDSLNDSASSVKVIDGHCLNLYENSDYGGEVFVTNSNIDNFKDATDLNDKVSSVKAGRMNYARECVSE